MGMGAVVWQAISTLLLDKIKWILKQMLKQFARALRSHIAFFNL